MPCSALSFPLGAEEGCRNRESKIIQQEITRTHRAVRCLNPSDLLLHSVFHNHSLVQNRSFSVKSTAEIFVLDNSSTLDISELCGLLLEGKNGLNNTDKVAAGTF